MRFLIFLLFLGACDFTHTRYRFGERVRISGVEGFTKCEGNVRNHLGLGYYQIDGIDCDYVKPKAQGIRIMPSMLVSESRLTLLWWQIRCSLGNCYTPVIGKAEIPQYLNVKGQWVSADRN